MIQSTTAKYIEETETSAVLTTDLSAAFDLIDIDIFQRKLQFYGVSENSSKLVKSFLDERRVITQIQGFDSEELPAERCGSIQHGSEMRIRMGVGGGGGGEYNLIFCLIFSYPPPLVFSKYFCTPQSEP